MRIKSICLSLLVSVLLTALLLVVIAFAMYRGGLSGVGVSVCIVATYTISNFVGGFLIGKCAKSRRFLWGVALSCVYFAIYLLIGLGLKENVSIGIGNAVITCLIIVISGMLGGMLSG